MTAPADTDPLYPRRHPRPPRNWVNDPNGLVHHGGRWHLFAQANPGSTAAGDICWWHADSADLLSWTDRGIALRPHPGEDDRPDRDGVWSGNAVSSDGDLVAFYSAFRTDAPWQPALRAVSTDDGATFTADGVIRATAPAVVHLPDGTATTVHTLRDPFVWSDPDPSAPDRPRWSLALGAGLDVADPEPGAPERYAALLRFVSTDLAAWDYAGVFHHLPAPTEHAATAPDTGEMWECPAYASLPGGDGSDVSVLIVCGWYRTAFAARALAILADRDGDTLQQRSVAFLDDGDALYAPSLLHAPDGRVLLWGWVQERREAAASAAVGWSGALSFPRELTIRDGRLAMWPVTELDALRGDAIDVSGEDIVLPVATEVLLTAVAGSPPWSVTLVSGETELPLLLDAGAGRAAVAGSGLSAGTTAGAADPTATDPMTTDTASWLRVLVDGSVVEAYTSAGRTATLRTYPSDHGGWHVRIDAGGAAPGDEASIRAWSLRPDAGVHR